MSDALAFVALGWVRWKPSAHSTGVCVCGAEPEFAFPDLGLLRCAEHVPRQNEPVEHPELNVTTLVPIDEPQHTVDSLLEGLGKREPGFYWVKWANWPESPDPFIAHYGNVFGSPGWTIVGSEQDGKEDEMIVLSERLTPPGG
jgi:hypothetical protein